MTQTPSEKAQIKTGFPESFPKLGAYPTFPSRRAFRESFHRAYVEWSLLNHSGTGPIFS